MAQRKQAFRQGKDDSGSELLASPEIKYALHPVPVVARTIVDRHALITCRPQVLC
jgi:hypothetical protein